MKIFCSNIIIITYWIIVIIVINNNFPHLFTNDLYVEFIFLARELKPANIQGLWLMKVRVRKWLFITRQFLNSFRQLLPNPPPSIKKTKSIIVFYCFLQKNCYPCPNCIQKGWIRWLPSAYCLVYAFCVN